jgi:hypothetical protein
MNESDQKSILIIAGNTELLDKMRAELVTKDVLVYSSRSAYEAVQILFTKQVDAVFVASGFAHVIESVRLFSTIPCSFILAENSTKPAGADFLIEKKDFDVKKAPEYWKMQKSMSN